MKDDILNISKQTLQNLSQKNIDATPKEYTKEFCNVSRELKLSIDECKYFQNTITKLSNNELKIVKEKNITNIYDLIDILLERIEKANLDNMSKILQQSLKPSISLSIDDNLNSFCIKIGDSPSLIFEEKIQQEMEKFIAKRFEVDKKIVARKTADIARLVTLMSKYLGDAIDSSHEGSTNVTDIKNQIKSLEIAGSTKEELNKLQNKLVKAAINIENEMQNVNKNLQSGRSEVNKLEEKIKVLEEELKQTKKKSTKDHLTGTLNRAAFEDELVKFDEMYQRLNQDFAVVFFDIDHFKKVNDTYGHDGGDSVLKTFASLLMKLTRDIDIVARFGGEEFVGLLHYNTPHELDTYIKRIKSVVTKNKFIFQKHKIAITFSAGISLRSLNQNAQSTITSADKLLYEAKNSGRNKIILWDGKTL